jgi:hypothetical protein
MPYSVAPKVTHGTERVIQYSVNALWFDEMVAPFIK